MSGRLAILALLAVASAFQGQRASSDADHSALAGSWRLDETQTDLTAENWRNRKTELHPPAPCLSTTGGSGEATTSDCGPAMWTSDTYNPKGVQVLNAFGPDLLEASPTLTLQIGTSSVTIGGELRETIAFTTDGKKQKIRVLVRHAPLRPPPDGRKGAPPLSEDVTVKTHWDGASLVQELSSEQFGTALAMTQTLLPAADGRQLFVLIDIRTPKLKPPLKSIRRVYLRGE
jgi:hypothetical protein